MSKPGIRRVVTGHDATAVAKILTDTTVPAQQGKSDAIVHAVWNTGEMPVDIAIGESLEDRGARPHATPPPKNGTRLTIIDYPPGNRGLMHRTETLDYVIVMSGEIDMVMDDSTVTLNAGDVMVQRGTNHGWFNRGTETARVAFVLVDAQPLGIGHPRT
jgi:mannose-6-phosphate isomerase-like protein (cupin superfamily)